MHDAANMVVSGDSRGSANFQTFENLCRTYWHPEQIIRRGGKVVSALNKGISKRNTPEIMLVGQGFVPIQPPSRLQCAESNERKKVLFSPSSFYCNEELGGDYK